MSDVFKWRNGLVTRGCGFESRLRQELSTTEVRPLSKAPNHRLLPGAAASAAHCSRCVCVCARGWVKCREHISLLVILCIIVYVTNKEKKNIILQNRYSIMVKCLNIGENIDFINIDPPPTEKVNACQLCPSKPCLRSKAK